MDLPCEECHFPRFFQSHRRNHNRVGVRGISLSLKRKKCWRRWWLAPRRRSQSPSGLGVDNALGRTMVTADGIHGIPNPYRNTVLFWALCGGGGGTWGVVTSVTYNSPNANSTHRLFTEIIRLTPSLVDGGFCSARAPRPITQRHFLSALRIGTLPTRSLR